MPQHGSPAEGTDGDELTISVEVDDFDPSPGDYSVTQSFAADSRNKFKGIFIADVVSACFNGEIEPAYGESTVMMVGRLNECVFGLVLDVEKMVVVTGHVLQVNPVQASMSGLWDEDAIQRMQSVSKDHRGKVWNGYDDPRIGNKVHWSPDKQYY